MAVLAYAELWDGEGGTGDYTRRRTYTRVFEVFTDSTGDRCNTVAAAVGIVQGDPYPDDSAAVCVSIAPRRTPETPLRWLVTYTYDTQPPTPDAQDALGSPTPPGARPENPLLRPVVWRVTTQTSQRVVDLAYDYDEATGLQTSGLQTFVLNTAGLPFDPPLMEDRTDFVLTATINTPDLDAAGLAAIRDATNKTTWYGLPPRTVRCTGISADANNENGVDFWAKTFSFSVKEDTWDRVILNAGFAELRPASVLVPVDRWIPFRDSYGNPAQEPIPLDEDGAFLPPGGEPIYRTFQTLKQVDFNLYIP